MLPRTRVDAADTVAPRVDLFQCLLDYGVKILLTQVVFKAIVAHTISYVSQRLGNISKTAIENTRTLSAQPATKPYLGEPVAIVITYFEASVLVKQRVDPGRNVTASAALPCLCC